MLIQLDERSVKNRESQQYLDIMNISPDVRKIIARNGVSVKGQLNILAQLRNDISEKNECICWCGVMPKRIYIEYVLGLAWNNLRTESDSSTVTLKQLVQLTHGYGAWGTPISELIFNRLNHFIEKYKREHKCTSVPAEIIIKIEDDAIKHILQVVRHWFEYKVPKWLSTVNSLQELVCKEQGLHPGDYSSFASVVENNFVPEHLAILAEYGVPHSAIKKLENRVPPTVKDDELISYIKARNLHLADSFIEYERDKIVMLF